MFRGRLVLLESSMGGWIMRWLMEKLCVMSFSPHARTQSVHPFGELLFGAEIVGPGILIVWKLGTSISCCRGVVFFSVTRVFSMLQNK